jgi:hypothetical protein
VAVLASAVSMFGLPVWPAITGMDKFGHIVIAGLVLGLLLDLGTTPPRVTAALSVIWLGGLYAWLAWPQIERVETWWILGGLELAGLAIVLRSADLATLDLRATVMVLVAALGLGGIVVNSGSLAIAQLGFALAAAVGGFALWNWPTARYRFGAAALLGAVMPLLALAALALLLTETPPWALAPLVLVFFADLVSRRLPPRNGRWQEVLAPVYLALIAAVPAALGVVLALLGDGSDDLYYR